jgi:hypothetical protein
VSIPGTRVRFTVAPGPKVEGLSDVEVPELWLHVARSPEVDIREAMLTGDNITRTIEGASTVTIPVADRDKKLLNSEVLQKGTEIEIDGLWFTLVAYEAQGDRSLKLTFEDSAVAELRDYPLESDPDSVAHIVRNSLEMTGHGVTRSQFAKLLVDEPGKRGDFPIGFVAPEYVNPNTKTGLTITGGVPDAVKGRNRQPGFPPDAAVTVKGKPATPAQLAALDAVLTEGYYMLKGAKGFTDVWRDLLIVAVMVTTQESVDDPHARVTDQYGHVHVGLFQQDSTDGSSWRNRGGGTGTDIAADAHAFFEVAMQERRAYPSYPRAAIALLVQNPGGSPDQYGQWQDEATATVEAWLPHNPLRSGVDTHYTGGSVTRPQPLIPTRPTQFQYTRGTAVTRNNRVQIVRESNWACLQRLANEVNWRCFAVGTRGREVGVIYFGPDSDWFSSQPIMSFSDDDDGIDSISGEWDIGQKKAALTVACRIGRWQAQPGSVVVVREHGPQSGRWLVASISRSLFSPTATVTLTKPQPSLPSSGQPRTPKPKYVPPPNAFGLLQPIPSPYNQGHGGLHETEGLPGYPAYDFFANAGDPVIACESGIIHKLSGHDPNLPPPLGPHGPYAWSLYLKGDSGSDYYYTHLKTRSVGLGQRVQIGEQVATVANYLQYGTANHVHLGVAQGRAGSPTIEDVGKAPIAGAKR